MATPSGKMDFDGKATKKPAPLEGALCNCLTEGEVEAGPRCNGKALQQVLPTTNFNREVSGGQLE